jgi:ribosomal protein L11 methyltransferase
MPHLEFTLRCTEAEAARYERALEDVGALSVTLLDAGEGSDHEQAILEPGVGEMPLWRDLLLTALFDAERDPLLLLAALDAFDGGLDWQRVRVRRVEDADWVRAWMDQFRPMRFGERAWVVPSDQPLPDDAGPDAAIVRLDPGLAFGSGTHPTTALCLQWLDALAAEGVLAARTVLDFGCGSGILALAAVKLGAAHADGVDNDPQALLATADNAARNGIAAQVGVFAPETAPATRYPVVVANILAGALDALAERLAARTAPGGCIALSGILAGQEGALLARYAPWFDDLGCERMDDWMRISGTRNASEVAR